MGMQLLVRVLATTSQLRYGTELSEDQAKRGIQDLRKWKSIESAEFGDLLQRAAHHWLTEEGLNFFGATEAQRSWHSRDAVGTLLVYDRLKVEVVNDIATLCSTGDWKLSGIQWFEREPMSAAGAYLHPDEHWPAYEVFCFVSPMSNEWEMASRLDQIPEAMLKYDLYSSDTFYPAGLSIVAADELGAAQSLGFARALLSGWMPPANIRGWYHEGDSWYVSDGESAFTGTAPNQLSSFLDPFQGLRPAASFRRLHPRRRFDRIVDGCLWAGGAAPKLLYVMTLLGQYPVISVSHLKALAGEGRDGESTELRLETLIEKGLAEIVASNVRSEARRLRISRRGQGGYRYALTKAGRRALWYAFGGKPGALYTRSELNKLYAEGAEWSFPHQDGVYEILAQYREGDVRWGRDGGPMPLSQLACASNLTGWYCSTLPGVVFGASWSWSFQTQVWSPSGTAARNMGPSSAGTLTHC